MNRLLSWIVAIAVGVVSALIIGMLRQKHNDSQTAERVATEFEAKMAQAAREQPGIAKSEAARRMAVSESEHKPAKEADAQSQANSAADAYFGAYWLNTRARSEFCKEQGVDISSFARTYEQMHSKETARAMAIYTAAGFGESNQVRLYEMMRPTTRKLIEQEMRDVAAAEKLPLVDLCKRYADSADQIVAEIHIAKRSPQLHKALMGTP